MIEFLNSFNWQTIIGMFAIGWYFNRELTTKIQLLDADIRAEGKRTDRLYEMFIDLLKERK